MSVFVDYERQVLQLLAEEHLGDELLSSVLHSGELVEMDQTGVGYFVTSRHPGLPAERIVLDSPAVTGIHGQTEVGFVVFIENGELTLECHSWGDQTVPGDLGDMPVKVVTRT